MSDTYSEICQDELPLRPWKERRTSRLPGLNPLPPAEWLQFDEAFCMQMAYRDHLVAKRREDVFATTATAEAASFELLDILIADISVRPDYHITNKRVERPDGVVVDPKSDHPLVIAGRLVQEDFCILNRGSTEHVLTGAILCFPASWLLHEKLGRPLAAIHGPVEEYDGRISRGVQRILDVLRPELPVWRANNLVYSNPDLFQPRSENDRRRTDREGCNWIRVERQTLRKLPATEAVVFGIHTYVVPVHKVGDLTGLVHGD